MKSEIKITVEKDNTHIPETITWEAQDTGTNQVYQADAMAFTVWDKTEKTSMGLHLWTKDMIVDDMYNFTAQTIHLLAETLENSTKDSDAAQMIHEFAEDFLKKLSDTK